MPVRGQSLEHIGHRAYVYVYVCDGEIGKIKSLFWYLVFYRVQSLGKVDRLN